jgi:hypothetical protein
LLVASNGAAQRSHELVACLQLHTARGHAAKMMASQASQRIEV